MLSSEPKMTKKNEHIVQSLWNIFFWCPFLDIHPTTHHLTIDVCLQWGAKLHPLVLAHWYKFCIDSKPPLGLSLKSYTNSWFGGEFWQSFDNLQWSRIVQVGAETPKYLVKRREGFWFCPKEDYIKTNFMANCTRHLEWGISVFFKVLSPWDGYEFSREVLLRSWLKGCLVLRVWNFY